MGCLKSLELRNAFVLKTKIFLDRWLTEIGPLSILNSLKEISPINLLFLNKTDLLTQFSV